MNAAPLSGERRTRLIRLLGMCASAFDGERANAAAMASRLLREAGLSWSDVIGGVVEWKPPPAPDPWELSPWRRMATEILATGRVTAWERNFLDDLLGRWRSRDLTEKQQRVLSEIYTERVVVARP